MHATYGLSDDSVRSIRHVAIPVADPGLPSAAKGPGSTARAPRQGTGQQRFATHLAKDLHGDKTQEQRSLMTMNKPRPFFHVLGCFAVLPWGQAIAQNINLQSCSFNGGRWIQTRYAEEGRKFRLDWSDGPKMTYTFTKPAGVTQQVVDSLGGQWRYKASTANGGLTLDNPSNGNRIVCAQAQNTESLHSITEASIGPVKLGMTLLEAKQALPKATFSRTWDGDGVARITVSTKGSAMMILFAGEEDAGKPINWSKRISSLETFSPNYATRLGVRPGSLVADTEKQYGKVLRVVESEIESRQYVAFQNQPRGMTFRIDYSGIFNKGQHETLNYRPDAKILSISIAAR